MNHTIWLNELFQTYTKDNKIKLFFEEKEKLKSNDIVLNLSIHPIRFADDIFFNFETNDDQLREKLKKYEVNYDMFYHYADILKATYIKTVKENNIGQNSLLIIGQTHQDKVLYDGKKYISLLEYIDTIKELASNYNNIYFKPHPYAKNNKEVFGYLKKEIPNITIIYDNIYHLLSNPNIKHLVGLNSSVLYEAKYFKKEVTFLYKPYFDFEFSDIGIYSDYFNSSFWSDILDTKDKNISLPFGESRLRKTINDFWGYNEVSSQIVLKDIIKNKIRYFLSKYLRCSTACLTYLSKIGKSNQIKT